MPPKHEASGPHPALGGARDPPHQHICQLDRSPGTGVLEPGVSGQLQRRTALRWLWRWLLSPAAARGERDGSWRGLLVCWVFIFNPPKPVSWEDWTPELLQVKNSKSNIFLVVFLYSN